VAISFASSYTGGTTLGGYTNVEISNNTILNLKPSRRGISLWNNSSDGTGGNITNAAISGNTISNAPTYTGEFGIRILGKATGTRIAGNNVSGLVDAVKIAPYNGHEATTTAVQNNSLVGTGYGVNNSTSAVVDASGNWYGSSSASVVAGKVTANVDYTPWLNSGTDTAPGTLGFQGDFSNLWVAAASPQTGAAGRITEGIGLLAGSGLTLNVLAGTYTENPVLNHAISLIGAGASTTIIDGGGAGSDVQERLKRAGGFGRQRQGQELLLLRELDERDTPRRGLVVLHAGEHPLQ
jgi:hypothetical protein